MRHWLQLASRNWSARPTRSALAMAAVALGVSIVVWVTCCYESVRAGMIETVVQWIGRSHITIQPKAGVWAVFDEKIEELARVIPGVEKTTTTTREWIEAAGKQKTESAEPADEDYFRIEAMGVVPEREQEFRSYDIIRGRFLRSDDAHGALLEDLLAEKLGVGLGDTFFLRHVTPPRPPVKLTVVGIVERRRASINQALMAWTRQDVVQNLAKLPNEIKSVDIILRDPSVENIRATAQLIEEKLAEREKQLTATGVSPKELEVKTTEAEYKKFNAAQTLLQFIMLLLSCVVLLTAFFIVLSTMSMGVTEKIAELGLLRAVGTTRGQVAGLVLLQTVPLGLAGTLIGVPLGLLLQWLTIQAVPDYIGQFAFSYVGVALAAVGGILTTLLGAIVPAIRASTLSPVEAIRSAGNESFARWVWIAFFIGLACIAGHFLINRSLHEGAEYFQVFALTSVVALYMGCALLAPGIVYVVARLPILVISKLFGLQSQLLGEEVERTPFRSGAVCCSLMVGLSLIVALVVWGRSVKAGWEFPKEFPDALLYSYFPLPLDKMKVLREMEGIREITITDDFNFFLTNPAKRSILFRLSMQEQFQRFLAIEPDQGLKLVKLAFLEGDENEAIAKLKSGGHVLVTREFARARNQGVGDRVTIWVETRANKYTKAQFTIAGVVASPGLDIAMGFFNAASYFQTYAVGAMIGTFDDAKRLFNRKYGKLILFNFDFDDQKKTDKTAGSTRQIGGETKVTVAGRPSFALGEGPIPGDGPEERVVNKMLEKLGDPPKAFVTARQLKKQIDENIDRVTLLLSAIPVVALLLAALGLGNLMAANVAARSREIALFRAIGVTRLQVGKMVIGEALVLGILGSIMGLALGIALGHTSNLFTELLSGFRPPLIVPWELVLACAGLATLLCILAALGPARYASRSNIVSVLADL